MRKTAIQQARETFDKLVNLKIDQAPLPKSQVERYAVAALPRGQMLMSTGKTKMSTPTRKVKKAKDIDQESLAPIGSRGKTQPTIGDLLLQIAVPQQQVGTGEGRAFAFANYINQLLRPRLPTAAGLGAPALLPDPRTVSKFYTPSAIANLPPLAKRTEGLFVSPLARYGTFLENTERIQKELAEKFLAQFARGERPAAYAALGGMGRTPLTAGYKTGGYVLPAPKSATAATIRARAPTFTAATIY